MNEIPDEIKQKLEFKPGRDLQQEPVVAVFIESNRPYLTRRQVQSSLKQSPSKGTVIDRLTELCEIGVLESDDRRGGSIYWINDERSDWPIPPDVAVEREPQGITVSEFFGKDSVENAVLGIGVILISSILIWTGGLLGTTNFSVFGFGASHIIAIGLLATLVGWVFFAFGVYSYFRNSESE